MNIPLYEDQDISCSCFNHPPQEYSSGLKPSRTFINNFDAYSFQRVAKSTEHKTSKESSSKIRTSLKRQKPYTPIQSRVDVLLREDQMQNTNLNHRIFSFHESKPSSIPIWNTMEQLTQNMKIQKSQNYNLRPHIIPFQTKRTNLIRNQPMKQQHIKADFNLVQSSKMFNVPFSKNPIKINYANTRPILALTKQPMIYIPPLQKLQKKISLNSQIAESVPNLKTSRQSKRCSLRGSQKKQMPSMTPRQERFKIALKQIQSVLDENDRNEDEISEVIGRGWDDSYSFEEYDKDERIKTQTHATTRASNIKNSSTIYSNFGIFESHGQK